MASRPIGEWYFVTFDGERVSVRAEPPGKEAWAAELTWDSIERVCFKAEGLGVSDGIYVFTSARPESYAIPVEANGGGELWGEILRRKLFDAELAIEAATATTGLFCWPPDDSAEETDAEKDKFADVPMDPDTRIVSQSLGDIDDLDALYQQWNWEGVAGESLVFVSEEIRGLGDQALEELVRGSSLVEDGSAVTIKRNQHGFTFVNFNFECD